MELLVVLVITAIALSIVTPSLSNSYEAWRLRSIGGQAIAMLRFASQTARRDATNVAFYYSDHQFKVIRNGTILKVLDVPATITVEPAAPQGAVFLPTGQMVVSAELTLSNQRGRKMIIRSGPLLGQIRLLESTP